MLFRSVSAFQGLTSLQLAILTTDQIVALTTAQAAALTTAQLAALNTGHIRALERNDLLAMSTSVWSGLSTAQVASLKTGQIEALTTALKEKRIAGAGLDVFWDEPRVPQVYREFENVVMCPHVGSNTLEVRAERGRKVLANLEAHFAGKPAPNPVEKLSRGD